MNTHFPTLSAAIQSAFTIEIFLKKNLQKDDSSYILPKTNTPCLIFPTEGVFSLSSSPSFTSSHTLKKEQALLLPAHSGYYIKTEDACAFFYVTFSGSLAHSLLMNGLKNGNYLLNDNFYIISNDLQHLSTLLSSSSLQEELELACFTLLLHLSNHTTNTLSSAYPPLVSAAIQIIEDEYTYLYGIEELAIRLEVTKHHLIRLFHEFVGVSPGQYLTSVKIKKSKILLASGEASLELIAVSCGFSGADYFRKVFKKETGISPKQYQRQLNDKRIGSPSLSDELYL